MNPCRQSVQDALDDIGGMAGIECPACGNDADWSVDAVNTAGSALMTCGACGKAGTIAPNTVQRLHLQHSRILGRIES